MQSASSHLHMGLHHTQPAISCTCVRHLAPEAVYSLLLSCTECTGMLAKTCHSLCCNRSETCMTQSHSRGPHGPNRSLTGSDAAQVHAWCVNLQTHTIRIDDSPLPVRVLQLEEQGSLGVQVGRNPPKSIYLLLQDVGEDCHIQIHIVTPAGPQN